MKFFGIGFLLVIAIVILGFSLPSGEHLMEVLLWPGGEFAIYGPGGKENGFNTLFALALQSAIFGAILWAVSYPFRSKREERPTIL